MSIKVMDEVLSRIILDKAFRELLRDDPERALAGYDLTLEERAALARLRKQQPATKKRPSDRVKARHPFSLN